jgi:hypothetical protein
MFEKCAPVQAHLNRYSAAVASKFVQVVKGGDRVLSDKAALRRGDLGQLLTGIWVLQACVRARRVTRARGRSSIPAMLRRLRSTYWQLTVGWLGLAMLWLIMGVANSHSGGFPSALDVIPAVLFAVSAILFGVRAYRLDSRADV